MKSILNSTFEFALALMLGVVVAPAQTAFNTASLPLWFEAGGSAPFAAHAPDAAFFLTATNTQFVLRQPAGGTATAGMYLVGSSAEARIAGEAEMPGKVNYLRGSDPAQWHSGVPVYAQVRVDQVYPGISVVYYGTGRQLEYDFDLAAGVEPQTIAMRFDGAEKISVNPRGDLIVSLNGGEIIQHRPVVYQDVGLIRHEISGGYKLLDAHTATFALGSYDPRRPLVIDPVLGFSTYFGGNNGNSIRAIALGRDNSIYVAGETLSTAYTNAPPGYQTNYTGGKTIGDAFVAKFGSSGTNFIYFTYLGGNQDSMAYGLAVDSAGDAFVTGFTDSADFPHTTNAFQPKIAGVPDPVVGVYPVDAFVTELNPGGSNLVYSTFLGGNHADAGLAIALDTNGDAYVCGYTFSTNFPCTNAYQSKLQCPNSIYYNANPFVAEIAPGGAMLKYGSFFGGTNFDVATAIAVDRSNCIYLAGYTASTNFPVTNSLPTNRYLNGTPNYSVGYYPLVNDAFVAKFSPGFSNLIYSTYLGGSNADMAAGIAVDTAGKAYVVGSTTSTNFPSTLTSLSSFVLTNTSGIVWATNAFLTQIGWNGTHAVLGYSTVFGGVGNDVATGVALDPDGDVFVVGAASSTNFPVTLDLSGSLSSTNDSILPLSDVFITAFNSNAVPLYSAYLGGTGDDFGTAIAVDAAGNAYIAGQTSSTNFPVFNPLASQTALGYQTALDGLNDGFVAKIVLAAQPVLGTAVAGTNLLVSWQPIGQESPAALVLESNTNLLSTNSWMVVTTNPPALSNGAYNFQLPHTNSAQFFRLHQY